ncbi:UDP-glucose:glycoprotein glucosyltransferase [Xylaria bambusicola]|uniref:UDP-glucose:glycoprotein glucosyltransferase n=1 Tax=Xylaria bambusicola TaxID=326684 RepID=UPI0020075EAB|nr:UDP-glucose:glycoprotein glucosyltransferase [Xylaria bambusicola]KAI0520861.1 UDP-glucose:glycoprotein glucosyltransferase [Xylaria bambusicola]
MIRLLSLPGGLAATLLAAVCLGPNYVTASHPVHVAMKAAFPAPPYLVELLETAAGENATSYFPLLDRIAEGAFRDAISDRALYERFLEILHQDGHFATPESLSTFKLALSLRTAAPRIEAHYQYYDTAVTPSLGEAQDNCDQWVLLDRKQYCSDSLSKPDGSVPGESQIRVLPFDRALGNGAEAILYADITKPEFGPFHKTLTDMARKGDISYRLRYRISQRGEREALPVSGYGVELQLKRTDYIVIDDREAHDSTLDKPKKTASTEVVLDGEEEMSDLKPLAASELAGLGLKTGSFIMESEDPFQTLIKLTQDFPRFSTSVAARNASNAFITEHRQNREVAAPAGANALWLNGVQLSERQIDPYTLISSIRRERAFIKGATDLGLTAKQAISLLGNQEVTMAKSEDEGPRFDWRDDLEDGRVIIWLNDIEKDKRYASFSPNLSTLMQMSYMSQMPQIRKDIFNLVVPVDLSSAEDVKLVVQRLQALVKRALPIRFGLVPLSPTKEAEERAKLVYYLTQNYGLPSVMSFLEPFMIEDQATQSDQGSFDKAIKSHKLRTDADELSFGDIFTSQDYETQLQLAKHWVERLQAHASIPPVFFNGYAIPREDNWLQLMSMRLSTDLQQVQAGVFMGTVTDDMWIPSLFLENALARRNPYTFPDDDNPLKVLNIHKLYSEHDDLLGKVPVIEADADANREQWAVLTLIADLSTSPGLQLLHSILAFRRGNPGVRVDIVHNPMSTSNAYKINSLLVESADKLLDVENIETLEALVSGDADKQDNGYGQALARFLAYSGLAPGEKALLLNGRIVGPINADFSFQKDDVEQLFQFEQSKRILPVYQAAENLGLAEKVSGPIASAKLTSITALSTISDLPEGIFDSTSIVRTAVFDLWSSSHTAIDIGDAETADVHFVALLNPTSEIGQRWAPILKVLSELDGVFVRIFLNPNERLEELPIKRFYRYVLQSEPSFDDHGVLLSPGATFKGLPSEALLNLGMDIPPAWLVAAKDSVHDLDNLKLSSIKSDVEAIYELENILIEGHSRQLPGGSPPRGVQLLLGTERDPHFADTIIMANIGYFQFKANPGYYNIRLQEGKSSDIFDIISVGAKGYEAVPGDEGTEVALMDFRGTTLYPRLRRKEGMETADVLEDSNSEGAGDLLSRGIKFAEGILGGSKSRSKSLSDEIHAEINIFSVASGHLYERMLNIMMVSVMKNTKHTVKFWFIEQFLSPSFKEFIPHLAKEYGFKYEMVTYKWPHWLRSQKEKQREIWGYKILFLDVLFPLSLDKVIFVDADQIVRTDMIDLINHDLDGAPYGFTPMCDSRTEMEGFRFWKQGYWKNYLRGSPYHISALYVVDLRRFRQLAAGDRLRQQYHQLSADPNSLSNLDQDLPNHMQFVIPIHSLPQEWLWCETWCSDESQKEARTIDLCNNPQTKEPKLDRARRQVPEWTVYDEEIAALDRRRKGLDGSQKIPGADELNTKSRRLEDESAKTRTKDEL